MSNISVISQLTCRTYDEGRIYQFGDKRLGPFSQQAEQDPQFEAKLAVELNVDSKEILKAQLDDYKRELSKDELNHILSTTIKRDETTKAVTTLGCLLAQTDADQFNIGFQAESSAGKSYIPQEIAEYFPPKDLRIYAGASPTSFFHSIGKFLPLIELTNEVDLKGLFDEKELSDVKRKVIFLDLEQKILIFLDMPHWQLMEKLRPLLSHDKKLLRYDITDKTGKGGIRTKTVIIKGYPAVIFATTKPTQEDQEKTRMWLLSPEVSEEKIPESLNLLGAKIGHREAFQEMIESHQMRRWLKTRIEQIRNTSIRNVIIPEWQKVLDRFLSKRPHLSPRAQRDFPRLLYLIKGLALLNCFNRTKAGPDTIIANQTDIDAGIDLYEEIAAPNELGLSPETYRIYEKVVKPLADNCQLGVSRKEILRKYFETYHRPLPDDRLRRQIIPALESAGLVSQEPNPNDRREMLVHSAILGSPENNRGSNSAPPPTRLQPSTLEGCTVPSPISPENPATSTNQGDKP